MQARTSKGHDTAGKQRSSLNGQKVTLVTHNLGAARQARASKGHSTRKSFGGAQPWDHSRGRMACPDLERPQREKNHHHPGGCTAYPDLKEIST